MGLILDTRHERTWMVAACRQCAASILSRARQFDRRCRESRGLRGDQIENVG
jgi:hypothetical protein